MNKIAMYKEEIIKTASQKKDDASREKDTKSRMWRDRVKPEIVRDFKTMPNAIGGTLAGGAAGALLSKTNPRAAGLGALAGMAGATYGKKRKLEKTELDRLSNKHFGKDATKEQHNLLKAKRMGLTIGATVPTVPQAAMIAGSLAKTPESVIQRARREKRNKE